MSKNSPPSAGDHQCHQTPAKMPELSCASTPTQKRHGRLKLITLV